MAYRITTDKVLKELARIAFANPLDYYSVQKDGSFSPRLASVTKHQAGAIKSIEDAVGMPKLTFHDKLPALRMIATHLGMFDRKRGKSSGLPKPIEQMTQAELGALLENASPREMPSEPPKQVN